MDKDVKNTILNMAESQLDEVLQMNGFKRRNNSLIYSRKCEGSIQKIEIMYFLHPSYYNHALAHIYPQLSVYYPDIQDLAKEILGRRHECSYIRAFSFYRVFIALFNVRHLFL